MESVTEFTSSGYQYVGAARLSGRIEISLQWPGSVAQCSRCGGRRLHSHGWRSRRVSHLPVGQQPCDLLVLFRRYRCLDCLSVHNPDMPLLAARSRVSGQLKAFVRFLSVQLKVAWQPLQGWLCLGWATLRRCLSDAPDPLTLATAEELRHLCLDEVFFCEPRRYQTVLSCASGLALGLAEGRGESPSSRLLSALPVGLLERVETLATDLNQGQRKAALAWLPNALVCADHFHVVRLIRKAMREAPAAQRDQLRPALRQLRGILKGDDSQELTRWLEQWQGHSSPQLKTLWSTINNWQLEIESAIETKRSTGPAEALNRKIALLRRLACGYTNLDNFRQRILWLNVPSHHQR